MRPFWHPWLFLCLLLLLPGMAPSAGASGLVSIDPLAEQLRLSDEVLLLADPEGQLTLDEVLVRSSQFRAVGRKALVTSFNAGVFWLQVALLNPSDQPMARWLVVGTAKTLQVRLHLHQHGQWQTQASGRALALVDKAMGSLGPVFPLTLGPGEQLRLLLRIDARGATDMATSLWQPQAFHQVASRQLLRTAMLLGGLLLGSALAMIIFARLRQTQYLWLGLLLLGVAGIEASRDNILATYLWPAPWPLPVESLALFAALAMFSFSKVVTHALALAHWLPKADRLLLVLRWMALGGFLLTPFSYGHGVRILSIVYVVQSLASLLLSLLAWHRSQPNARLFLFAFSLALLTEIARQLANLGLLPWLKAMEFSTFFFILGSSIILLGLVEQTRQLREQLQVAEQLQQAKTAFLARISHELRSPLNSILGLSRMLGRGSTKLSLAEGTQGIEKSALRLLQLVDELLDEMRAQAGHLSVNPTALQLRPWIEEVIRTARLSIEENGNRLLTQIGEDLPERVLLDGARLRQVLDNLLANANRHTHQGSIRLSCQASLEDGEVVLEFAVEDDGEGIDETRLQSIFEPFVRAPEAEHEKGFGLGLSICRELLRQMDSDIDLVSAPGMGTCFSFSLRALRLDSPPHPLDSLPLSVARPALGPRALVVDDDPLQLEYLASLLRQAGFETCALESGEAALERIAQEDWDVLITDQMMPHLDGWGLLRGTRDVQAELPVVLVSSMAPWRPETHPPELMFDATLLKPLASGAILASVWPLIVKPRSGETDFDWQRLGRLASEGDLSGMEDWVAECRTRASPRQMPLLHWVEGVLHRLDFQMLVPFA